MHSGRRATYKSRCSARSPAAWAASGCPACPANNEEVAMFAGPIQDLIDELARMPGIGPKSAQRVAFYLLQASQEDAKRLATAILDAKEKVRFCESCFNVSDQDLCEYCRSTRRDQTIICVVQDPPDIVAI